MSTVEETLQVDDSIEESSRAEMSETQVGDATEALQVEKSQAEESPAEVAADSEPAETPKGFASLGLTEPIVAAASQHGYETPTPIQEQTIPLLLAGRDVLGQAQTGTGKTAAFAMPLLQRLDLHQKVPQVLVLAPTRELAIQVAESFEKYATEMRGLQVASIYGGQDYQIQFRQLKRGAQVVVGTPGRVMDHMRRGSLLLDHLQCLVLDEADEMLKMGFAEDVEWVLGHVKQERQMALFSATMPPAIRRIAQQHLQEPAEVTIVQKAVTADTINQRYLVAGPRQKSQILARVLEAEPTDGVLIFVKTKVSTELVAEELISAGFSAAALNGDMPQKQRERIVERLKSGGTDIIVATDVAARGLDVQRISHVINYDLPHDSEAYVHRIGRTGRAGRSGEAILFVHPRERKSLHRLEQATRKAIKPMELPSNRDVNKQRVAKFHGQITQAMSHDELETFTSIIEHYRRENDVPLEMIAAALAVLANKEEPLLVKDELKVSQFGDHHKQGPGGAHRKQGQGRRGPRSDAGLETYRVEVGRQHRVQPGNLVGAIANEANLDSSSIGRIRIFDRYSTVDLPSDLSNTVLHTLANATIGGRKLRIAKQASASPRAGRYQNDRRKTSAKKKTKSRK